MELDISKFSKNRFTIYDLSVLSGRSYLEVRQDIFDRENVSKKEAEEYLVGISLDTQSIPVRIYFVSEFKKSWYTLKEVRRLFDFSETDLCKWVRDGLIQPSLLEDNYTWCISKNSLLNFISVNGFLYKDIDSSDNFSVKLSELNLPYYSIEDVELWIEISDDYDITIIENRKYITRDNLINLLDRRFLLERDVCYENITDFIHVTIRDFKKDRYTIKEVAIKLCMSVSKIKGYIKTGDLHVCNKKYGEIYIEPEDIVDFTHKLDLRTDKVYYSSDFKSVRYTVNEVSNILGILVEKVVSLLSNNIEPHFGSKSIRRMDLLNFMFRLGVLIWDTDETIEFDKDYYNVSEVSRMIRVDYQVLLREIKSKGIGLHKNGKNYMLSVEDIKELTGQRDGYTDKYYSSEFNKLFYIFSELELYYDIHVDDSIFDERIPVGYLLMYLHKKNLLIWEYSMQFLFKDRYYSVKAVRIILGEAGISIDNDEKISGREVYKYLGFSDEIIDCFLFHNVRTCMSY